MRAAREKLRRLRRTLDILRGGAADEIPRQILDQADAGALRRKGQVARGRGPIAGRYRVELFGNELGVMPLRFTCSMRPAICALVVSLNLNSLKM